MQLRCWQGNGLGIHRSRVQVLAGHFCKVALSKMLASVCLCHQAVYFLTGQGGDLFGWESNRRPGWKLRQAAIACGLTARNRDQLYVHRSYLGTTLFFWCNECQSLLVSVSACELCDLHYYNWTRHCNGCCFRNKFLLTDTSVLKLCKNIIV